jgi:nucleoid DNA-binding protein
MTTKKTSTAKTPSKATTGKSGKPAPKATVKPVVPAPAKAPAAPAKAPVAKAPAAKAPVAKAPAVKGISLSEAKPGAAGDPLKKKELFERVKARATGVKGREVRQVLDAVLEELGLLLAAGEGLNAQPLGNLKVQKRRETNGADVVVCKLRRKKPKSGGKDPLAEAAE